ncbi:hypothetical protein GOBAR_DD06024 [Gossypium barbadense]|nr:hypothetical protein GOBAR_DD06024 [Gossypium barbadense]
MIALYYSDGNVEPIELIVELADVESLQNITPLNQQHGVHDPYIEVPRVFVGKRSSLHEFDFDMSIGWVEPCDYGVTLTSSSNPHSASILYNNTGKCRVSKGWSQAKRIQNHMDLREKGEP